MEKKVASELMTTMLLLDDPLNKIAEIIEQISDEDERKFFRKGIASVMGRIYTDLERPIIKQYSDFDIDKK